MNLEWLNSPAPLFAGLESFSQTVEAIVACKYVLYVSRDKDVTYLPVRNHIRTLDMWQNTTVKIPIPLSILVFYRSIVWCSLHIHSSFFLDNLIYIVVCIMEQPFNNYFSFCPCLLLFGFIDDTIKGQQHKSDFISFYLSLSLLLEQHQNQQAQWHIQQ